MVIATMMPCTGFLASQFEASMIVSFLELQSTLFGQEGEKLRLTI